MRILTLTNCPLDPRLGSGKTVLHYSEGLRRLGHSVTLLSPPDYEWCRSWRRLRKFRQAFGAWRRTRSALSRSSFDLVEFYGDEFWLATLWLSRRRARPLIVAHTNGLELLASDRERRYRPRRSLADRVHQVISQRVHRPLSHLAFARADTLVTLTETDRDYAVRQQLFDSANTAVVEPGLDPEFLAMPFREARERQLAFTGSWIERKGISTLCAVVSNVLRTHADLTFHVYGSWADRAIVLGGFAPDLHERIFVHPPVANGALASALAQATVFFFPTQYEGFGIALAEAMACGCAVVTTPTGFGASLIPGEEALLCDFDDRTAMEASIRSLVDDDPLRRKIAQGGWHRVQSLRWEDNIRKLESAYVQWTRRISPNRSSQSAISGRMNSLGHT